MFLTGTPGFIRRELMTKGGRRLRIYTVVEVWRGMASSSRTFTRLKEAKAFLGRLKSRHDLQEDDVRLFEGFLRTR